ncbi:unnamed protein product [Owenia fusiformis]|uniref:Uncharacterized protein n=1 Tax=Owenia fusiformis TaxID=6347 RepID=A0A8J1XVN5_OWEFU|nr:unnamed protein product [Owenia fusiformis]
MAGRPTQSLMIQADQLDELIEQFNTVDQDGNGYISLDELDTALNICGFKLPGYEVRNLVDEYDKNIKDGKLDFEEFKMLFMRLRSEKDIGRGFKKNVRRFENIETHTGLSSASADGTTHSVKKEETIAFSDFIARNFKDDEDCKKYLPLHPEGRDLYQKIKDGILLCKMINRSQPDTIDERTINKTNLNVYKIHENLILALNSAQSIGCNIVNIGPEDLEAGKPHLVLGLIWQVIKVGLLGDINLSHFPGLKNLLGEDESMADFMKLSPEQILIRWVNYHLERAGVDRRISNFTSDIKDSFAYIHLLKQISPKEAGVVTGYEEIPDLEQRAEEMLKNADKIECRSFVTPPAVVSGNYKLNLAFVANLFNNHPGLDKDVEVPDDYVEETREEKTYRNWMNSMGVNPYVHYLYSDLIDGLVIFQLYDIIQPGIVNWSKVVRQFTKMSAMHEKIGNCNYAIEIGKELKFKLVAIGGKDLYDGIQTLTLGLVWQLMRAYTINVLTKLAESSTPVSDKDIISWANEKLKKNGKKGFITSFQDEVIKDGIVVIDLIDAIKPHCIKYENVRTGTSDADKLANARYAISMARKVGAKVYALPEDVVEGKKNMVMTLFACLMACDNERQTNEDES